MMRWQLEAMGFNVQIMPLPEVYLAIQQGTVSGQENPIDTIYANKFYEVAPNVTLTKHVYSPIPLTISEKTWQKLSPADREAVTKAAKEAADWSRKEVSGNDDRQLAEMDSQGRQDRATEHRAVARSGEAGVRAGEGEVRRRRRRDPRRRRSRAQGPAGEVGRRTVRSAGAVLPGAPPGGPVRCRS